MSQWRHEVDDCSSDRSPEKAELLEAGEKVAAVPQEFEDMCPNRHAGLNVDPHRPCTRRKDRLCHIFGNLKAWNRFFWDLGLELQETSSSELSLVEASDGKFLTEWAPWDEGAQAVFYMSQLLARHHCVVEATITDIILANHLQTMCHAIRESRGLKRIILTLSTRITRNSMRNLAESISSLTQLQSLSMHGSIEGVFLAVLAPLLASTSSLTVLRACDVHVENPPINTLKKGLFENTSITELSLSVAVLNVATGSSGPGNLNLALATYLRTSTSLKSLTITAGESNPAIDVCTICHALSDNAVLVKLDLQVGRLKPNYATPIKKLLTSSKTLKYFSLSYAYLDRSFPINSEDFKYFPTSVQYCQRCHANHCEVSEHMQLWITTLLTDGMSLKELSFSMSGLCPSECHGFLRAMARNQSLERLKITNVRMNMLYVCSILTENSLRQRVVIDSLSYLYFPNMDIPLRNNGGVATLPFDIPLETANHMRAGGYITEMSLQVESILCTTDETEPTSTAIVQFIKRAPFIKHLELIFWPEPCNKCWNLCASAICDAVLHNPTIRGLAVRFIRRRGVDMASLAGLLHRSRALREFELQPWCPETFKEFVTELMTPEFENNHALQRLTFSYTRGEMMSQRLHIQSILQRNQAMAKRAAAYVTGIRAKYTAEAFETMLSYPVVIEELETAMHIQRDRATQLIADNARRIANFTEFMSLAGVVRDSVECNPCDDGKTQLADLPEECLNHIRQFLRFSDVRDSFE